MVKNLFDQNSFFVGTSGNSPGVYVIDKEGKCNLLKGIESTRSIYSLSFLEDKSLLGFCTRNKPQDINGTVEVYKISKDEDSYSAPFKTEKSFFAYTKYSSWSFNFFSKDIYLSGSLDGSIYIWSVFQKKPIEIRRAHEGMILKLMPVTDKIFASLGVDSELKFWDVNNGMPVYRKNDYKYPAQINNIIKFFNVPSEGFIISHHPCGTVLIHDFNEGLESRIAEYNNGKASSISVVGDQIILSDISFPAIKVYSLSNNKEIFQSQLQKPIYSVDFTAPNRFVIIYNDASAEIWDISEKEEKVIPIKCNSIRSVFTPYSIFSTDLAKVNQQLSQETKIQKLKDLLNMDNFDALTNELHQYMQDGLSIEAMVVLAEWCKLKNKPLWELKVRLELCKELPEHEFSAVHFYAIGELLENINEPKKALEYYMLAGNCNSEFKDVRSKISSLQNIKIDESKKVFYENADNQLIIQEINKKIILGEKFSNLYLIKSFNDDELSKRISELDKVYEHLDKENWKLDKAIDTKGLEKAVLYSKISFHSMNNFYYGLIIREIEKQRFYQHVILYLNSEDITDDVLIVNFNNSLKLLNTTEFNAWYTTAQKVIKEAVNQAYKGGTVNYF